MADPLHRRLRAHGFTLLELLVTISLAAIVLAYAVPNLASAVVSRNAEAISNRFVQDAAWARTQAVANGSASLIKLQADCSWNAYSDASLNTPDPAHSLTPQQALSDYPGASCPGLPASGLALQYDPNGLVSAPTGASSAPTTQLRFQISGHTQASQTLEVYGSGIIVWRADATS